MVSDGCIMLLPESWGPGEQIGGPNMILGADIWLMSTILRPLRPSNCSPGLKDSGRSIMQPSETIIYQSITIQ